ncbi:hypothetical protein FACS189479_09740 [Spirochaetia bacterium]|nr:hypothetical protein FACS189479_09740 [Spirochaetia bacterium]
METVISYMQNEIISIPIYSAGTTTKESILSKLDKITKDAMKLEMTLNFIQTQDERYEVASKIIMEISKDVDEKINGIKKGNEIILDGLRNIISKYYKTHKSFVTKISEEFKEYSNYICIRIEEKENISIDSRNRKKIKYYINELFNKLCVTKEMILSSTNDNIVDVIIKLDKTEKIDRNEILGKILEPNSKFVKKDFINDIPEIIMDSQTFVLIEDKINEIIQRLSKDGEKI